MIPELMTADQDQRAPGRPFKAREFGRIVALTRPYRRSLILGLLCTVFFAGLHTTSIGGAFPVFQILLEDEGLHGWMFRAIAGQRLGVTFAVPPTDAVSARILHVAHDGPLHDAAKPDDDLSDAQGRTLAELFRELAMSPTGAAMELQVGRSPNLSIVSVSPRDASLWTRALLQLGLLLPESEGPSGRLTMLAILLAALVTLAVISNALRFVGEVLVAGAVLRGLMDLRDLLYVRVLHLPMTFFAGARTSDLVTRFVQDIQEIQRGLVTLFGKAIREPLRAVFLIGLALFLDWRITLTVAVVVPVAAAIFIAVGRRVKKANRELLQAYGSMIGALTASLQSLRVVKCYTAEEHERVLLDRVDKQMLRQQLRLAKLDAFLSPMMETIAVFAGSLLIIWLAGRVLDHTLPLPKFATLGVTLSVLFDPLRKMTDIYVRIQRSSAGAERIFGVLEQPAEVEQATDAIELGPLKQDLVFENVEFTYPGGAAPALNDVSLTINRGETVAIVGPNGSGKTTLMSMLPRLFDPDRGRILYDDVDIRRSRLVSLRRQIGLVSQEAVVFAGTPAENIAYGDPRPDQARVEDAARRAFADEFIRNIPGGYNAIVGERGTTLSGGQRQRLAIARAIYRDAPVLVFDEATSQVDSESEQKIQQALREFARGRTTIIIAHRLSTIQFADRIIVLDGGRVIDSGTHRQLFDRCPLYRSLCETQFVGEKASD